MLFDKIKGEIILAMKRKESVKKTILQMVISESSMNDKNPNDEQVIKSIKALIKSNKSVLVRDLDNEILKEEISILESYLPAVAMSDEEFKNLFEKFAITSVINEQKVAAYRAGDDKVFGFIMGNMVKVVAGQIDSNDLKILIQKEFNTK